MRQFVRRIRFEFDALLEVDEVQFDFLRAVIKRQVCDERVHQCRLTGARLTGNEHVLRGTVS